MLDMDDLGNRVVGADVDMTYSGRIPGHHVAGLRGAGID